MSEDSDSKNVTPEDGTGSKPPAPPAPPSPLAELEAVLKGIVKDDARVGTVMAKVQESGAASMDDVREFVDEAAFVAAGLKPIEAKKARKALGPANPPTTAAPGAMPATPPPVFSGASLLPVVPEEKSFLEALVAGGVLEIDDLTIGSAARLLCIQGISDVEDRLEATIKQRYLNELKKPYPPVYRRIKKSLSRKRHRDVLEALEMTGQGISQADMKQFTGNLSRLWKLLAEFDGQVKNWVQAAMTANNLAMGTNPLNLLAAWQSGNRDMMALSGIGMQLDASAIVDTARTLINDVNALFAGDGALIARMLMADAMQVREVLQDAELLGALGCGTREEMLQKLGLSVGFDAVRTERAIAKYILAAVHLPDVSSENVVRYIVEMQQVCTDIKWGEMARGSDESSRASKMGRQTF